RFRLRWFRRKQSEEQAPIEAAAPVASPEPVIAEPADEAGQPTSSTKPRRRRGSRGGRGRSKKTATAGAAEAKTEKPADKYKQPAKTRPERKPQRRDRERPH